VSVIVLTAIPIVLVAALIWSHRQRRLRPRPGSTGGSRRQRFRHRRRRQAAAQKARSVSAAIMDCRHDPTAHLAAGVVLHYGEIAWTRTRARLTMRSSHTAWVAYTHLTWGGRHARNISREISAPGSDNLGDIDWLITSQRIVGRQPASSELISVWWSGLAAVEVDLHHDRLTLNDNNGWTGQLAGPAVSPIAVAAVGMCHGPEALAIHPDLAPLRTIESQQATKPPKNQPTLTNGATIAVPPPQDNSGNFYR
jgi:hypothetical protein